MNHAHSAPPDLEATWQREAIRLHRRYVFEIVEACGLCPWAEPARVRGRTRDAVVLATGDAALDASLEVLDGWAGDERIEVGFLIYPRIAGPRARFEAFASRVRDRLVERHPLGRVPFMLAAFHPEATPDTRDAERLIPFLRRTPDPCVQIVRASVLERVRSGAPQGTQLVDITTIESLAAAPVPTLRERIAQTNLETASRMGIDELGRRLDAILRDREETYRELARRA